jgi:hypothetical protein
MALDKARGSVRSRKAFIQILIFIFSKVTAI